MKAINDTVVVKILRETHEAGGLQLHSSNNDVRYNLGEVITASPNTVLEDGDHVYYDGAAGSVLRHNGKKFLILRERDIRMIVDAEE